jgi:manganese transport protein
VQLATRRRTFRLLGPAFVASVAYIDPGNVGTNVAAGARYGYTLVWVVVLANLTAILVQFSSAKLGIVTRRSLASHLSDRLPRGVRIAYWLQAEAVAAATDLAEVVGGAIALAILFHPTEGSWPRESCRPSAVAKACCSPRASSARR